MVILSNQRWQGLLVPNYLGTSFNTSALSILAVRLFVVVTLVFGATISSAKAPPVIVGQPKNQLVVAGSNAFFSVAATGDNPVYQWYFNDTHDIIGALSPTLILTNVQAPQAGSYSVSVSNADGAVTSSVAVLSMLTVPINPYPMGTLGYDLFKGTYEKAGLTNSRTASYNPNASNLGTNTAVWTWPINLSCVGYSSSGYQSVLITSNKLLTCGHYGGEAGQTVTFHDTNGVPWIAVVTNTIHPIADLVIAQLSNAAPASIVIPYVLPPNYTNYLSGHTLLGMPAFWLHKNTGHIDYAPIADIGDYNWYGYGTWVRLNHTNYGFSGSSATGGDSGAPAFLSWSNCPILLFAASLSGDVSGLFVSGRTNWNSLAALGLTNGLKVLNLSGYPLLTTNDQYTGTLTVNGPAGSNTNRQTNYVYVSSFSASPLVGFTNTLTRGLAPFYGVQGNASSGSNTNKLSNANSITNSNGNYMYTGTLAAIGIGGTNTNTQTNKVNVSPLSVAPAVKSTGTPTKGLAPIQVMSSDASSVNITLNAPATQLNVSADSVFTFTWQTTDVNPAATIALFLDVNNNPSTGLIPIASGIQNQTVAGPNTSYVWQANPALAGTNYYVYATLTDGTVSNSSFAPGQLKIDSVGAFQLLSSIVVTNASYVWQYAYYGTNYTGTNQLILGANVISVTNGTAINQFIVTRVPSLAQVDAVQYNQLNQVTSTTNGNGIVTTLTYDPLGRLVQRQSSNGALVIYAYDVLSRRTSMTDYTGTTFYQYDTLNRLTNVTTSKSGVKGSSDNLSLSYEYDLTGNKTAIIYPSGERIQYSYDNAGRITTIANITRNLYFQYTYNPLTGQLIKLTRPNGIETDYRFDGMGRLTNILHQFTSGNVLVAQFGYTLDAIGKATLFTTQTPNGTKFEQYKYDYCDRLTNVIYADSGILNDTNNLNVSYTYDGNGNRQTMATKTNNAVIEIRYYVYGNENRLITVTNQSGKTVANYNYDPAGNRIQKVTTSNTAFYNYDERNLMTIYGDKTNQITYTYNGDAQRVSKTLNGKLATYIVDPSRNPFEVVQERCAGIVVASYTFGATRLATWNDSGVCYELNDRLGSVRLLTDVNGNVITNYDYDVFGAPR